jgi:hypothetical protein
MIDRYTEEARTAVAQGRAAAAARGQTRLGAAHLLLGLIEARGLAARVLSSEVALEPLQKQLEALLDSTRRDGATPVQVQFEDDTRRILSLGWRLAQKFGLEHVGGEHLLLVLVGRALQTRSELARLEAFQELGLPSLARAFLRFGSADLEAARELREIWAQNPARMTLVDELLRRHRALTRALREWQRAALVQTPPVEGLTLPQTFNVSPLLQVLGAGTTVHDETILKMLRHEAAQAHAGLQKAQSRASDSDVLARLEELARLSDECAELMEQVALTESKPVAAEQSQKFCLDLTRWLMASCI